MTLILAAVIVTGTASWVGEQYGNDYLALPDGAGQTVTICAARCKMMTSTDAGPDKAMQQAGRVADIGVRAWEYICGIPRSRGLCAVTVEYGPSATLPPTDSVDRAAFSMWLRGLGWFAL